MKSWIKKNTIIISGALPAFLLALTASNPPARNAVRSAIQGPGSRVIISRVSGDFIGLGERYSILKVRDGNGLFIEVYKPTSNNGFQMVDRTRLEGSKDGHFTLHGVYTNLALEDVDGDGRPEILTPSYDETLTAHLNVFRYNPVNSTLDRVTYDEPNTVAFFPTIYRVLASVSSFY